MMQITDNPRRQHECREEAERAIEIFYPARYIYEVAPVVYRMVPVTFAVKVHAGTEDGARFLGFAYDPDEEAAAGGPCGSKGAPR